MSQHIKYKYNPLSAHRQTDRQTGREIDKGRGWDREKERNFASADRGLYLYLMCWDIYA